MQASTTLMVPEKQLTRIQGMNQMLEGGLGIAAAPLGALVVSALPMVGVLGIDIATAVFAIVPLIFIVIPQPKEKNDGEERPSFWQDFRSGLAYAWNWKALLYIMGMAMLVNFLMSPAVSLLPLLVSGTFDRSAYFLSMMEVTLGVGVIVGGILLTTWGGFKRRIITTLVGLVGIGVSVLFVGITPQLNTPNWAILGMICLGFAMTMTNGPVRVIMQAAIAPEMQGRIFSLIGSMSQAMAPLGLILAGPLADRFGVPFWFILAGGMTLLMAGFGFLSPTVLGIENGRSAQAQPLEESSDALLI
jgi:DHA3 family macrolide efflux protein-like MFS transporter